MNEKLLSVIVTVYNEEKFLPECLKSILNQTYKNIEIILVNDGSTDLSKHICEQYALKDNRIKVVHQENMGMINARYTGVKIATGEYIIFCDADDFIEQDMYKYLMEVVNTYTVDMVTSGCYRYYDKEHQIMDICTRSREGYYDKQQIRKEIVPYMLWEKRYSTWALDPSLCLKVIRKQVLLEQYKKISKYNFSFGEDSATIYPAVLKMENIYVTHYCGYYHRQRQGNAPAGYIKDAEFPDKLLEVYRYLENAFLDDHDFTELKMQLDMFFIKAAQYLKQRYPEEKIEKKQQKLWMFPFGEVEAGSNIVLYGAGKVGKCFKSQLEATNYCQDICWVDRNPPANNKEVKSALDIDINRYDYIVIAIESEDVCKQVKKQFIKDGCEPEKIVISDFERQIIYV